PVVGLDPRKSGCRHNQQRLVEVPAIMRALDPEVGDAVWAAIAPLIPAPDRTHPLGCHRPRASDRDCFNGMLVRLATGCSWEDAERLTGHKVSDTTMRLRRDEWIAPCVLEALEDEPAWVSWRLQTLERLESWNKSTPHRSGARLS